MTTTTSANTLTAQTTGRDWLRIISISLALIGLLIAGYVLVSELTNTKTICAESGGWNCDLVQKSIYSKVGPIPVTWLGVGGYLTILALLLLEPRVPLLQARGKMIVFGLTLFGVLFSGYLTLVEAVVLQAWCMWCVGSAITMLLLFLVSLARLWSSTTEVVEEDEEE